VIQQGMNDANKYARRYPYHVGKVTYDKSTEVLRAAISHAKIGREEKLHAFKRLANHSTAAAIQKR